MDTAQKRNTVLQYLEDILRSDSSMDSIDRSVFVTEVEDILKTHSIVINHNPVMDENEFYDAEDDLEKGRSIHEAISSKVREEAKDEEASEGSLQEALDNYYRTGL